MVLTCEFLVDWVKHAFIVKFNEIPVEVYKEYTVSIAYDLAASRHKNVSKSFLKKVPTVSYKSYNSGLPLRNLILGHKILGHFFLILGHYLSNFRSFLCDTSGTSS